MFPQLNYFCFGKWLTSDKSVSQYVPNYYTITQHASIVYGSSRAFRSLLNHFISHMYTRRPHNKTGQWKQSPWCYHRPVSKFPTPPVRTRLHHREVSSCRWLAHGGTHCRNAGALLEFLLSTVTHGNDRSTTRSMIRSLQSGVCLGRPAAQAYAIWYGHAAKPSKTVSPGIGVALHIYIFFNFFFRGHLTGSLNSFVMMEDGGGEGEGNFPYFLTTILKPAAILFIIILAEVHPTKCFGTSAFKSFQIN